MSVLIEELDNRVYLSTKDMCTDIQRNFGMLYSINGATDLLHGLYLQEAKFSSSSSYASYVRIKKEEKLTNLKVIPEEKDSIFTVR